MIRHVASIYLIEQATIILRLWVYSLSPINKNIPEIGNNNNSQKSRNKMSEIPLNISQPLNLRILVENKPIQKR